MTEALDVFNTMNFKWVELLVRTIVQLHKPYMIDIDVSVHALKAVFFQW